MSLTLQEIIEFPILKLNGRTMEIESTFHMYVQPVVHPQLTPFCTEVRAMEEDSRGSGERALGCLVVYTPFRISLGLLFCFWELESNSRMLLVLGSSSFLVLIS